MSRRPGATLDDALKALEVITRLPADASPETHPEMCAALRTVRSYLSGRSVFGIAPAARDHQPRLTSRDETVAATAMRHVIALVAQHQPFLAWLVREGYHDHGRGVLNVEFSRLPAEAGRQPVSATAYVPIEDVRAVSARDSAADMGVVIAMAESYEPDVEGVVLAWIIGGDPVLMKMRLDSPSVRDLRQRFN